MTNVSEDRCALHIAAREGNSKFLLLLLVSYELSDVY
jgi:hypothetical protein